MINSLLSGTNAPVKWKESPKTRSVEKTAKAAMTDSYIDRIKAHAKKDAERGVYMSPEFNQMRLSYMEQNVSPNRSGPKAEVMSAIQAALKEPHPMLQALEKMLEKLSGGGSANLKISGIQQAAEVYAPNGENIASYNSLGGGWTDIQTKEEHKFLDESTGVYLQAYREARSEIKSATQEETAQDSASAMDVRV